MVFARGWREGNESCCSMDVELRSGKMESSRDLLENIGLIVNNTI